MTRGREAPAPRPSFVEFKTDLNTIYSPGMSVKLEGMGSSPCAGGQALGEIFRKQMRHAWTLEGDSTGNALEAKTILVTGGPPTKLGRRLTTARLRECAEYGGVPLLALLPDEQRRDPDSAIGKKIGNYLQSLEEHFVSVLHKWRGNVLLASCPDWVHQDTERVRPIWAEVRQLRETMRMRPGGMLELSDILALAARTPGERLGRLEDEIPGMGGLATFQPLLAALYNSPDLRAAFFSEQGVPFAELARRTGSGDNDALRQLQQAYSADGAHSLRGEISAAPTAARRRHLALRILDVDGRSLGALEPGWGVRQND